MAVTVATLVTSSQWGMRLERCQASFFIQQRLPDSASIPAPGAPRRGQRHLYSAAQRRVSQSPALPSGDLWRRFPRMGRASLIITIPFPGASVACAPLGAMLTGPWGENPESVSPLQGSPLEEAYPLRIASHVHLLAERDMSLKTCRQH